MTRLPISIPEETPVTEVADVMVRRKLKRLPVVDAGGKLTGMVSRLDLLRTVAQGFGAQASARAPSGLQGDLPLARAMRTDVPVVRRDTPLGEVLQAVVSTQLNHAVVVDGNRRVQGVVSDEQVLARVTPALRPSALRALMHRLPFSNVSPGELEVEGQTRARNAADLMRTDVATARQDQLLREVIGPMIQSRQRLVAVLDDEGRLVGALDRADILRGLVHGET
jgi:CBS domain-containing protein